MEFWFLFFLISTHSLLFVQAFSTTKRISVRQQRQQEQQKQQQTIRSPWRFSSPPRTVVRNTDASLSELEVRDTAEGTGEVAKNGDIVTIKYTGSIILSPEQQQPEPFDKAMITFKLGAGKVLTGCDRGIVRMRVGGTRVLRIPSNLGYGAIGFGGPGAPYTVPPNADLEFVVQLTAVASGKMAEVAAGMGIGLDPNTTYLK